MTDRVVVFWERHKLKVIGLALIAFFVVLAVRTENTRDKVVEVQRIERTMTVQADTSLSAKQRQQLLALIDKSPKVTTTTKQGASTTITRTIIVKGQRGERGQMGPVGPQGKTGSKGKKGDTGEQGPRGYQGLTGATGAPGNSVSLSDVVTQVLSRLTGIVDDEVKSLLQTLGLAPR